VPLGREPHDCRPVERFAVRVHRRSVDHRVARSAAPSGVAATVAEADLMPYQDLPGTELVSVGAAAWWAGDPRASSRADEVTDVRHAPKIGRFER
jgi:hypothetical protein